MNGFRAFGLSLSLLFSISAFATDALPPCMVGNKQLLINNAQVSRWKTTTKNQYVGRGHVRGRLSKIYPMKNNHAHFQIEFDGGVDDTLEVVYSLDFGKLPRLAIGMEIEACGDYITSIARTPEYPASPDGAIIHWIHASDNPKRHPHGYVAIDGRVFGGAVIRRRVAQPAFAY